MLKNESVATIDAPEFINVEPYNPLISQCEIKVLYLGENRNGSYITEEVARDMANSLPGTPIVAAYIENKDDFSDHGHVVTIEDGEIKFSCKTQPYGFVAPDANIWFQNFTDTDEFGNEIERKYLMTTGYLWTGQYPEIQKAIDEGMPQSMELDEESLDGHWATNNNSGYEFFIINDATFSKLCILGSDVEPCFEGASVTDKQVSKNFTKNPEFSHTLFTMMNDLKDALQNKGGSDMLKEEKTAEFAEDASEEPVVEFDEAAGDSNADSAENSESTPVVESASDEEEGIEPQSDDDDEEEGEEEEEEILADMPSKRQEFACGDKDKDKYANKDEDEESADGSEDDSSDSEEKASDETSEDPEEEKKPKTNHSLEEVEAEFAAVKAELESVKAQLDAANVELDSLRGYKLEKENQQKDALIAKYHMLSDEDKAEIAAHKEEYTLEQIEAKLAVLYVQKNVDFSTLTGEAEEESNEDSPITTFSLDAAVDMTGVPDIVKALRAAK